MRKMNCRILAATLLAVQIAVAAMPATALAAENDQVQETVQEQVEAPSDTAETTEEAPVVVAEVPAEEPEEVAETQPQEESAVEVAKETETTEETKTPETEAATAATENKEEAKTSEKPEENQAFDQTVTVDNVKIKVTAESGAFEEGAKLSAARVPSTQLKEVENAVADARAKDELVKSAYAFDVKIMSQDGRALQPAAGKKVKVSFATEEAVNNSLSAVVYHIVGPKDNIKAQKLATTINREAKAAEAQTTGLSYYVVEFISKVSADENADPDKSAKTETTDDTDKTAKTAKTAKTETTEDTKTTGKTDPVPEDKNSKTETVTPAAKDTAKANTETPAVKKETKTDNKKSEVKKEKKSENKKAETAKKEKKDSKKTEKAKANTKKSPKTGDTSNMVIWITTSLLAVGGIVVLLLFRRRLR